MTILNNIPLLNFILCVLLGIFVLSRGLKQIPNVIFGFSMIGLGLWELGHYHFLNALDEDNARFWAKFSLVLGMTVTPLWLVLSMIFARTNGKEIIGRWKFPLIFVLLIFAFFIAVAIKSNFIEILAVSQKRHLGFSLESYSYTYYIFQLLIFVLILINFENTFRSSFGSKRWQIKYFLLAFTALIAFWIFMISQYLLFSFVDPRILIVKSSILICLLGIVAFTLVRRKILTADVYVSRPVVYNSLTLLLVGGYLILVGITAKSLYTKSHEWGFFYETLFIFFAVMGLSVLLLSENLKIKTKSLINRHFFSSQYDFRLKWLELTESLGQKVSFDELVYPLLEFMVKTISVKNATLWLYNADKFEFRAMRSINTNLEHEKTPGITVENQFINYFNKNEKPWTVSDLNHPNETLLNTLNRFFPTSEAGAVVPLIASKHWVGLMTLGPKITGENFNLEDIEFLNVIGKQAASVFLNARLSQEIIKAKENEAFHQASLFFIHDLKNFVTMLSLVVQNSERHIGNPEFQKDAFKNISDTVQKMQQLIQRLTNFSKGIQLNIQHGNINEHALKVIQKLQGSVHTPLEFDLGEVPSSHFDFNHMETVFTNLIINADEASGGKGKISVKTYYEDSKIVFEITDQGVGFSKSFKEQNLFKPFRTTKSNGMGFGLFQSNQIALAHKGEINIESEEGKGSRIMVSIPLTNAGTQHGKK